MPVHIVLGINHDGRKSGEADVDFESHDEACEAMKMDQSNMGATYLLLNYVFFVFHLIRATRSRGDSL